MFPESSSCFPLYITDWQIIRLFVLGRKRAGTEDDPEERVDIAGTTGNIYEVVIGRVPKCTCPDNVKGNQCKHIVYV